MQFFKTFLHKPFHSISPGLILLLLCLAFIGFLKTQARFDETLFQISHVVQNTQSLAAEPLLGRGIGTQGQLLTEGYLETFFKSQRLGYQTIETKALLPQWSKSSQMAIPGLSPLELYKDFKPSADYYGKGIDYHGDLLYLGQDLFMLPKDMLRDKIVILETNRLTDRQLDYLASAEAAGVLYEVTGYFGTAADPKESLVLKDLSLKNKVNASLFIAQISAEASQQLAEKALKQPIPGYQRAKISDMATVYDRRIVGLIPNCVIEVPLSYQQVNLKHYLVTIKGKRQDAATSFITHYDGNGFTERTASGQVAGDIKIYPSVLSGGVTTALLMELASVTAQQKTIPDQDINFIFMEGLSNSLKPSQAVYTALSEAYGYNEIFLLEDIGTQGQKLVLNYDNYSDLSRMSAAMLFSQLDRFSVPLTEGNANNVDWSAYSPFKQTHNALIAISGERDSTSVLPGGSQDTLDKLNTDQVLAAATLLLGHLDLHLFKEKSFDFILTSHLLWIGLLGTAIFILRRLHPLPRLVLDTLIPFGISLILINIVLCIPKDANLKFVGTVSVMNFSFYETLRTSYLGLIGFFSLFSVSSHSIFSEISLYLGRSFVLIGWGLFLAIGLGLFKGLFDSYLHRKGNAAATWSSILLYSIPDVLVAFLGLVAVIVLSKWPLTAGWLDPELTRKYLMPLLSLCVVPSIYIARLVFVALEAELQKDYVSFLRYKGLSLFQIYCRHFSKVGFIKILDMSKPIIMLLFSNLMIVEYLFNYPGIMYDLLSKQGEPLMVISMALSIGLSFTLLYALSQLLVMAIAPRRSRL